MYFFIWTNSAKQANNKKSNSCCGDDSLMHSVLWSMNRIRYNCVDDAFQMWQITWINRNNISGIHWQIFKIATAATFRRLHFLWWERIIMMCVLKIFQNTKWCVSWYKVSNFWLCNYETKTSKYCIVKHTQHHFWSFLIIWNIIFWMQQHLQYRKDEVWQYSHDSKISWFSSELFGKVASYLQDRWLALV